MLFTTNSQLETELVGKKLATKLKGGDILLLSGDLGVGKTSLVKGIAKGLGIKHEITSPTFTLMNVYEIGIKKLIHIDTYRLKDEKSPYGGSPAGRELLEIGVEDYLGKPNTICIIEWPEKISGLLKNLHTTKIALEHGSKPEERKIQVS